MPVGLEIFKVPYSLEQKELGKKGWMSAKTLVLVAVRLELRTHYSVDIMMLPVPTKRHMPEQAFTLVSTSDALLSTRLLSLTAAC